MTATATAMSPPMIRQRLDMLAKREKVIRATPSADPDTILSEDRTLEEIRQERHDLAQQLKQQEERARVEKQAKADTRTAAREEALAEADKLRASLLKRAKAFEDFIEDFNELCRLEHVAHTADKYLQAANDDRAMHLDNLEAGRSLDRTRVALTNAFGPDLFGVPPYAAQRNAGYGIRDAIECKTIRLY